MSGKGNKHHIIDPEARNSNDVSERTDTTTQSDVKLKKTSSGEKEHGKHLYDDCETSCEGQDKDCKSCALDCDSERVHTPTSDQTTAANNRQDNHCQHACQTNARQVCTVLNQEGEINKAAEREVIKAKCHEVLDMNVSFQSNSTASEANDLISSDKDAHIPANVLSGMDQYELLETFHRDLLIHALEPDLDDLDEDDQQQVESSTPAPPPYPVGDRVLTTCEVCLDVKDLFLRTCCRFPVCEDCVTQYFTVQVQQGISKIECLNFKCTKYVHRDEILARLDKVDKEKFYRFLVEANKEPHIKTCPQCCQIMTLEPGILDMSKIKKKGLKVVCPSCFIVWCFPCQAPWHEGVNCKDFRKGDRLLRKWAKEHHYGQANAQKCPKCKVCMHITIENPKYV